MKNVNILIALLISAAIGIAVSSSHPTSGTSAYTSAPGDSFCTQCHNPSASLNGTIEIQGLPAEIVPGETYSLSIVLTNTVGSGVKGGFQMLVLNNNNQNTGSFSNFNSSITTVKTVSGGRTYFGHQPAQNFPGGGVLTWDVDWTAPVSNPTSQAKFYVAGVIGNNANSSNGDRPVSFNIFVPYQASNPDPLNLTITNVINPSCSDTDDGSATVNVTGGTPPYNYLWNNGETTATANDLPAGMAVVTVTDAASMSANRSTTLTAPQPIVLNVNTFDASCFGSADGSASATATGGTGSKTFAWSNGGSGMSQNNLLPGSYTVTATDANGCEESTSFMIGSPDQILINVISIGNVSCFGGQNGYIQVEAEGGSGGFTYEWSNGGNGPEIDNLAAGNYRVTVTDQNDCTSSSTYNVSQPTQVNVNFTSVNHVTCFGLQNGVATAQATGGNGNFTYAWSNGANGPTAQNLAAGTYMVTAIDVEGCDRSASVTITEPLPITIQLVNITPASCSGANDGSITIDPNGSFTNFQILWSNGATTATNANIPAGMYTVTVTDPNQCTKSASYTVGTNAPFQLSLASSTNVSCFGLSDGQASVTVSPPGNYNYMWSNGATGSQISNLPAGTYICTASDNSGCESSPVEVTITQPAMIVNNLSVSHDIPCYGNMTGEIVVSPSGGSGTFSVLWSTGSQDTIIADLPAGTYGVTITDSAMCSSTGTATLTQPDSLEIMLTHADTISCFGQETGGLEISLSGGNFPYDIQWSNGDTTEYNQNLGAGQYQITVTDSRGCSVSGQYILEQPEEIVLTASIMQATPGGGNDGAIDLEVSGGTGTKTALWSTGDTSYDIDSLGIGNYTVTITDENQCTVTRTYTVSLVDCQLTASYESSDASCFGESDGSITVEAENPIGSVTTILRKDGNIIDPPYDGLSAGVYELLVVDSAFCSVIFDSIVIGEGPEIIVTGTVTHPTTGQSNGSIDAMGSGGTGPLMYAWYNAAGQLLGEGNRISGLKQGFYFLITTDSLGCEKMQNFVLQDMVASRDESLLPKIHIYPNPSFGTVTLQWETPVFVHQLVLKNALGQSIRTYSVQNTENSRTIELELSNAGVYFIDVYTEHGVVSRKILSQQ